METKWIEWVEPFDPEGNPVFCRISSGLAIATQKKTALLDFMTVHWAAFVTEPKVIKE